MGFFVSARKLSLRLYYVKMKKMKHEEKIFRVMKVIKEKSLLAPKDAEITYRAGYENLSHILTPEEEIAILNKLETLKAIRITYNAGSEYI